MAPRYSGRRMIQHNVSRIILTSKLCQVGCRSMPPIEPALAGQQQLAESPKGPAAYIGDLVCQCRLTTASKREASPEDTNQGPAIRV